MRPFDEVVIDPFEISDLYEIAKLLRKSPSETRWKSTVVEPKSVVQPCYVEHFFTYVFITPTVTAHLSVVDEI